MSLDIGEKIKNLTFTGASNGHLTNVSAYISAVVDETPYMELFSSITEERLKRLMCDCDYFVINTHGNKDGVQIGNNEHLSMDDINDMDFSGLKLAIIAACLTAKDYSIGHINNNTPVNFTEKLVCQGAETVIGFNQEVMGVNAIWFTERFTQAYVSSYNYTAAQAKAIALDYGYWEDGFEQMVELAGNGNVRFSED